jgi:hypothetical protein
VPEGADSASAGEASAGKGGAEDASAGKASAGEAREDREEWRVQYTRQTDAHCSVSSELWPLQAGAFEKRYRVGSILGKGSFSTVFNDTSPDC